MDGPRPPIPNSRTHFLAAVLQSALLVAALLPLSQKAKASDEARNAACQDVSKPSQQVELAPLQLSDGAASRTPSVSALELSAKFPRLARKAFEKALKALRDSQPGEARRQLEEALVIEPKYFQASTLLAALLFNSRKYLASRLYAERARTINPQYLQALEILGALDALDGEYPKAIGELAEVVRLLPRRQAAHYYLGVSLLHQGKCNEGTRQLKIAAELRDNPLRQERPVKIAAELRDNPPRQERPAEISTGPPKPLGSGRWGGRPPQ